MFESPQVVRVRNVSKKVTYKDLHANIKYSVDPGGEIVVPWDAATLWMGDPRVVNDEVRGFFQRDDELLRVLTRLGSHGLDQRGLSDIERASVDKPALEVYDINNNRIEMLLDDPEGDNVTPASFVRGEKDDLFEELDKVKAYQSQLLALIEEQKNAQKSPGLDAALDDSPQRIPGPVDTQ